jgi:hypothetical protein
VQNCTPSSSSGSNRGREAATLGVAAPATGTARASTRLGKRKRRGRGLRGGAHLRGGRTARWPAANLNSGRRRFTRRWCSGASPAMGSGGTRTARRAGAPGGVGSPRGCFQAAKRQRAAPAGGGGGSGGQVRRCRRGTDGGGTAVQGGRARAARAGSAFALLWGAGAARGGCGHGRVGLGLSWSDGPRRA